MRWTRPLRAVCLAMAALAAAAMSGCGPSYAVDRQFAPRAVTPRIAWRVGGSLDAPIKAVDGLTYTAAVSVGSYTGATLDIDLGEICVLNLVIIDHGPDEMGFCRRVVVETSTDGTVFVPRAEAPGTRKVTFISLVTPVLARYVRLKAVQAGDRPWSVAEVHIQ